MFGLFVCPLNNIEIIYNCLQTVEVHNDSYVFKLAIRSIGSSAPKCMLKEKRDGEKMLV